MECLKPISTRTVLSHSIYPPDPWSKNSRAPALVEVGRSKHVSLERNLYSNV